jgi:hypothetical protein
MLRTVFSRDYRDYKQQLQRRWQERVAPQQGQHQQHPQQQRRSTLNAVLARKYGDSAGKLSPIAINSTSILFLFSVGRYLLVDVLLSATTSVHCTNYSADLP